MSLGVHCWQWQILYRYLRMSTLWQAPTHANTSLSTYAVGQSPYHISFGLSGFSLLMSLPACPACGKVFNKFASFLVHFFHGLVWFGLRVSEIHQKHLFQFSPHVGQAAQHEKGKLLLPEYFTNLFPSQARRQARSVDSCQWSWLLSRSQKILTVIVRHMQIKSDAVQPCAMFTVAFLPNLNIYIFSGAL